MVTIEGGQAWGGMSEEGKFGMGEWMWDFGDKNVMLGLTGAWNI